MNESMRCHFSGVWVTLEHSIRQNNPLIQKVEELGSRFSSALNIVSNLEKSFNTYGVIRDSGKNVNAE